MQLLIISCTCTYFELIFSMVNIAEATHRSKLLSYRAKHITAELNIKVQISVIRLFSARIFYIHLLIMFVQIP